MPTWLRRSDCRHMYYMYTTAAVVQRACVGHIRCCCVFGAMPTPEVHSSSSSGSTAVCCVLPGTTYIGRQGLNPWGRPARRQRYGGWRPWMRLARWLEMGTCGQGAELTFTKRSSMSSSSSCCTGGGGCFRFGAPGFPLLVDSNITLPPCCRSSAGILAVLEEGLKNDDRSIGDELDT